MEVDFAGIVQLFDKDFKRIPIMEGFPNGKRYDKYKIKGAKRFYAQIEKRGKKNILLFQNIEIGNIDIWVSDYLIYTPIYIYCIAESESLELHTTILGESQYRLKGFNWRRTKAGQYNLIYLPSIENEVYFRGFLRTFDIHLTKELLFDLSVEFPQLQPLVTSIQNAEMDSLYREFSYISLKTFYQIIDLFSLMQSDKTQGPDIRKAALDLAKELIGSKGKEIRKYRYNYEDVEALHIAAEYLTEFMNRTDVFASLLAQCATKSKLTRDKLREGFQLIFACSPKHYLLNQRMEKGLDLLKKGFSLQDICEQTGYSKVSHFETAFSKFYGYSPKELRQQKG